MLIRCIFLVLLTVSVHVASAQTGQDIIRQIEDADSDERIRYVCDLYDQTVTFGKTPEIYDTVIEACYRIAEKDNDSKFKAYLDFYKRVRPILFIPVSNLNERKAKILKIWEAALEHYTTEGDEYFVAICNAYIGHLYFMQKEYDKSIEKLLVADEGFSKSGYDKFPEIGKHLHSMALILYFFRQYEKVAELMEISVTLHPYRENFHVQRYYTLGAAYIHLKQYDKAEIAFKKTAETAAPGENTIWLALASQGLGKVYFLKREYPKALYKYESALKNFEGLKNVYSREYSIHLLGLANTCIFMNNLSKARQYINAINYKTIPNTEEQLFTFGVSYQDINYLLDFYEVQQRYHYTLKNYENAYFYADSLYAMKYKLDSVFNRLGVQVVQNRIEAQHKQYESDKKNAVISSKNQQILFITCLLAAIILTTLLIIRKNNEIKRKNKLVNTQLVEISETLDQKQVLLAEIHHRVKNNLQLIISLLTLHKESAPNAENARFLTDICTKIQGIALIHEQLYISGEFENINLSDYLTQLVEHFNILDREAGQNEYIIDVKEDVKFNLETILPVGIIYNELLTNSLKYAKVPDKKMVITMKMEVMDDKFVLKYSDNGPGLPNDTKESIGLWLIHNLVKQLQAESRFYYDNGAHFNLIFKEKKISKI